MNRRQIIENSKQMSNEEKKTFFANEYTKESPTQFGIANERACNCEYKMQKRLTAAIKSYQAGNKDALKNAPMFFG